MTIVQVPALRPLHAKPLIAPVPLHIPNAHHRTLCTDFLVKFCSFVPNSRALPKRPEFIHILGWAVVRVRSTGLVWVANHLLDSENVENIQKLFVELWHFAIFIQDSKEELTQPHVAEIMEIHISGPGTPEIGLPRSQANNFVPITPEKPRLSQISEAERSVQSIAIASSPATLNGPAAAINIRSPR
jgi:hypothetical protein